MKEAAPPIVHHVRINDAGQALARYLHTDDQEEFRLRRMAFTNKVGQLEAELKLSDSGKEASASKVVFEVRLGALQAMNDYLRGKYDGYIPTESTINAAVEDIQEEVKAHPGYNHKSHDRRERVLEVLLQAAQTVYTPPLSDPQKE